MSSRMTVGDLMKELEFYDKDLPVFVYGIIRDRCGYDYDYMPNIEIATEKYKTGNVVTITGHEDW
jgi:hypothetical protein